jgi:hypothetical protein
MDQLHEEDGYTGPATLTLAQGSFEVSVDVRGQFQPIDGRYHWYGRIAAHPALTELLGSAKVRGTLSTPQGSAPCEVSEPDPWQRYRVSGVSTPPYAAATSLPPE